MWSILILLVIALLTLFVSKRNYKNRAIGLYENFNTFNKIINDKYNNLSEEKKKIFVASLEKDLYLFFTNVILKNNCKSKPQNIHLIQQQMIKQEEIMRVLKPFLV
ncbi:hypothetical protein ACER0A_004540 [Haloimpatiens sp. FM7315]|uniref:hypothetical protein n=1 Tax=Haloimpatiens sp. FM7315 TaxID=3298609 RepID=UPI00370B1C29